MTTVHIAHAVGSTGSTSPAYRVQYAERKGWELTTIEVDVRYDVDVDDGGGRSIERTITVPLGLTPEQRQRLADIAERTPVTLAIRGGTPITTTFQPHND